MKKTLNRFPILVLIVLSALSCRKDPITSPPAAKMPYLKSIVQPISIGTDSFAYTYTGNIITGMDYYLNGNHYGFYQYRYQLDSNIVWWSWNTGPYSLQYSYLLQRDSTDKITSLTWKVPLGSSIDFKQYKAIFKYNGNKLDAVYYLTDQNLTGDLDTTSIYKPTYTGDDVTAIVLSNYGGGAVGSQLASYTYGFDATKNSFAAVNKNYWLLGYNYRNTETFYVSDVIVSLSVHNIISETSNGITTKYNYTKDSSGNIIASSGGGKFYLGYK